MYTREVNLMPEGEDPARLIVTVSEPCVVAVLIVGKHKPETVCGVATCNPSDKFDARIGAKLAVRRACNIGDENWFSPKFARHYSVFRQMLRNNSDLLRSGFLGTKKIQITYPIAESGKTMTVEYEAKAKKENE